jgi:hypothetical protein
MNLSGVRAVTSTRHSWGPAKRLRNKTERQCKHCGVVKVTRHEWECGRDVYWTEFWRDLERIERSSTPPCEIRC